MRSVPQFAIVIALAGATLIALPARAQQPEPPLIVVTGASEARVKPDVAWLTVGVVATGDTAVDAQTKVNAGIVSTLAALSELGIRDERIGTASVELSPIFAETRPRSRRPPPIVGYDAEQLITVQVDEIDNVARVLDAVLKGAANALRGLAFGLRDTTRLEDALLADALRQAKHRADVMARALNLRIASVHRVEPARVLVPRSVASVRYDASPPPKMAAGAVVPSGELEASASVSVTYRLGLPEDAPR